MGYLTEDEKKKIERYLQEGVTPYKISKILGRSNGCIYQEIKKGTVLELKSDLTTHNVYRYDVSIRKTQERGHNKGRSLNIGNNIQLADKIEDLIINQRYSPYSAIEICKNDGFDVNFCLNTLYNYIHNKVFLNLSDKHLLRYKKKKKDVEVKRVAFNHKKGLYIDNRPQSANNREEFGHWELDSVVSGQEGTNSLLCFTERLTRYELIFRVGSKTIDNTISVINSLENEFKEKFPEYFKTITTDNGTEFLRFEEIERSCINSNAKRTMLYYCHPYRSNERGSNENQNRIIRRFIPKGADIGAYDDSYISYIQDYMNTLPRRIFGGKSSAQLAHEYGFV